MPDTTMDDWAAALAATLAPLSPAEAAIVGHIAGAIDARQKKEPSGTCVPTRPERSNSNTPGEAMFNTDLTEVNV